MAFSFDGFEVLLKQNFDALPDFNWSPTSDIGRIVNNLKSEITLNMDSKDSVESVIETVLGQLNGILNDPTKVELTKHFDIAAANLASGIISSFNILRGSVKDMVESLSEEVLAAYKQNLVDQGAEVLIGEKTPPSTDFNMVDWGNLSSYNYVESLKDSVTEVTGVRNLMFNVGMVAQLCRKAPFDGFTDVKLSAEVYDELVAALNNKLNSYTIEELKDVTNILFLNRRYNGFCRNMVAKDVFWLLNRVKLIKEIISELPYLTNLSSDTMDTVNANIELVKDTLALAEFRLLVLKNNYDGMLIIDRSQINGSEYRKFTSDGGTMEDIAYHIRAFFNENAVLPNGGISTKSVLEFRDRVSEIIESKNTQIRLKMTVIKAKALNAAIQIVLDKYLKDLPDEVLPEKTTRNDFYVMGSRKISRILNTTVKTDNIEDVLYGFVISIWHPDSLIETMYKYLGREYLKLAENNTEVTDKDLDLADAYVVSTLLAEYFCKRHRK